MGGNTSKESLIKIIECSKEKFYKKEDKSGLFKINNLELLEENQDDCMRFLTCFLKKHQNYKLDFSVEPKSNPKMYPYIVAAAAILKLYNYVVGNENIISGFTSVEEPEEETIKIIRVNSFEDFHVFKYFEITGNRTAYYNEKKIIINANTDNNLTTLVKYFDQNGKYNYAPILRIAMNMLINDEMIREKFSSKNKSPEELIKEFIIKHSKNYFPRPEELTLYKVVGVCPSKFVQKKGGKRWGGHIKKENTIKQHACYF